MPGPPPPDRRGRPAPPERPDPVVALFVAVSWGAVVFATWGVLAVVLDREPVPAGMPTWWGLLGFALSAVVVWLGLVRASVAAGPWVPAVSTGAGVLLVSLAWGATGGLRLIAHQASSPFVLAAVAFAVLAAVGVWAGVRRWPRGGEGGPPPAGGGRYPR